MSQRRRPKSIPLAALLLLTAALGGCGRREAVPELVPIDDRPFPPLAGPGRQGWVDRQPLGWRKTAVQRRAFSYDVDREVVHEGEQSARLSGTHLASGAVASISQSVAAESLRDRRIALCAQIRQEGIRQWAHMWVVARDATQRSVGAAREPEQALIGDADWREVCAEIDVPTEAATLAVGFVLLGPGTLWIDDVRIEDPSGRPLARLTNPDFER